MRFPGRPLLAGAVLAASLLGTAAAAASSSKLDARILARRAVSARGYAPAGAAARPGPRRSVLIRVAPGTPLAALRAAFPDAQFGSQSGDVVTARADDGALDALALDGRVMAVEAGVRAHPVMDAVRSSATSAGMFLGTIRGAAATDLAAATGSGVIVGVVDTGIDYAHKDFINDGPNTSRILAIWDQTISSHASGPFPSGYAYGAEYSNAQLTTKIQGGAVTINTKDTEGHGTHVASIAAGDGTGSVNGLIPSGTFKGVAPSADIIFVRTTFDTADVVDGVSYIVAKAAAAGKRAVINLSLGTQKGPHDGTSTFESSLGAIAATTPVAVAMGNDGNANPHAGAAVGPGGQAGFVVSVDGLTSDADIEFWHPGGDSYTAFVELAGVVGSLTVGAGATQSTTLGSHFVQVSNGTNIGHPLGDKRVYVYVNEPAGITAATINITLTRTVNGGTGRIDGWVDPAGELISFASYIDNTRTLGEPACALNVFGVGSYASKQYWDSTNGSTYNFLDQVTLGNLSAFSSQGPTRDGRQQPDVSAPGDVIAGALSADPAVNPDARLVLRDGTHQVMRGTSMATPVVSGILAARLQSGPTRTVSELRDILRAQARTDAATGAVPSYAWGYGKAVTSPQPVSAPTGLSATTMGPSSVTWNWSGVTGADVYRLYYATNPSVLLASVAAPPYVHTGLAANTTTGVLIKGVGAGVDGPGAFISTSTLAAAPAAVPSATAHITSATVSWTVCPAAPAALSCWGYSVAASTAADGSGTLLSASTADRAVASLDVTGLQPLTTYYFRQSALNYYGAATSTGPVRATTRTDLPAPISPQFSGATVSSIRFDWNPGGNAAGTVYVADASTSAAFAGTVLSSSTRNAYAIFSGMTTNTSYYFRVQATNGPYMDPGAPVATLAAAPAAAAVPFSGVALTGLTAAWTAAGNPAGTTYVAEVSASASFSPLAGSSTTRNAFASFTGLTANTLYHARVLAVSHGGLPSAYATIGSTPTSVIAPTLPAQPFSSQASDGFTFTFVPGANASGTLYTVRISTDPLFSPVAASVSTTGASASFTGLSSNQRYYADAAALNVSGTPTAYTGAVSTATTVAAPGAPASPVFARTTASLSASWTTATLAPGTNFTLQASLSAGFASIAGSSTTGNAFAAASGLAANTSYYLRVRAVSSYAPTPDGPWTPLGSGSTLANAPSPAAAAFPVVGVASVTVAWIALPLAPAASACEGYLAELSAGPAFSTILRSSAVAAGAATAAFTDLAYATTYYARVASLDREGNPNYLVLGSTRTGMPLLSSGTVSGGSLVLALPSSFAVLPSMAAEIAPGTFPPGTVVTMLSGVTVDLSRPSSLVAALTPLGLSVGVEISAGGVQPSKPVRLTLTYDPAMLPSGADPRRLLVGRYDEASGLWTLVPSAVDTASRRIVATLDHFSSYAPFLGTAGGGLSDGTVFPQPWEAGDPGGSYGAQSLTFANYPAAARIRVLSLTGELVWEGTTGASGVLSWDGRNKSGRFVASGVYLAVIEAGGARKVRRVAVIR